MSPVWILIIILTYLLSFLYLFFLAVLPISADAAWNNPFTVEMTAGPEQFPGLSGWARVISVFIVLWVPGMLYTARHTKPHAIRHGTRWLVVIIGTIILLLSLWILITGYVWNFIQCIGSTLPEPLWCSPFSIQAVGVTVIFVLFTIIACFSMSFWK